MHRFLSGLVLYGLAILAAGLSPARGAELTLLSVGAMRPIVQELALSFERSSGHRLALQFASGAGTEQRIDGGEAFDLAIMGRPRIEKLAEEGKIVTGSIVVIGRSPIGVAVRKGAPHPDIGSAEAFKKSLLAAKSIAYVDPASGGTTGMLLAKVMEELGIAAVLKLKTRLIASHPGGPSLVAAAVANGEAEIGMQSISELMPAPGIDIVGTIPAELQSSDLIYAAGIVAGSKQPQAAKAFIQFLASSSAIAVDKDKGLQPP